VLFASNERDENVQPVALEREKRARVFSGHEAYLYQLISICVKIIRVDG